MSTIYIVRHATTEWNTSGKSIGNFEVPLNDEGRQQALQTANYFKEKKIDKVYSSPLSRAHDTAQAIAIVTNTNVEVKDYFSEIDSGKITSLTEAEIKEKYPWYDKYNDAHREKLGVDPIARLVKECRENILPEFSNTNQNVIIVTHKWKINSLLMALGTSLQFLIAHPLHNASITKVRVNNETNEVVFYNSTKHLK